MDIAVIGASGSVGRAVCGQLLATGTMWPGERLQLVGRRGGASGTGVFGLRIDLLDAYAHAAPVIEQVLDADQIRADVVIMVAGQTPSVDPGSTATRDAVAAANLPLFEYYAQALAEHGTGREIVIIQSNPVELAVDVFARHLGTRRVLGAGAYSDSLRFRREIADGFVHSGLHDGQRPVVTGYVLGEHGPGFIPLWSSLRALGVDGDTWRTYLQSARGPHTLAELPELAAKARLHLSSLLLEHHGPQAFEYVSSLTADARAIVKPWFAHWTGRTSTATAHSVVDIVAELRQGHRVVLPLQVACDEDDWLGMTGVLGMAVDVDLEGRHFVVPLDVTDEEEAALRQAMTTVGQRLADWQT